MKSNSENFFRVRTVLDIGCGFGSFGAHLFAKHLLTMCIANYKDSGSQVQLTLEKIPTCYGWFISDETVERFLLDLDIKPFESACKKKFPAKNTGMKASKLCSSWVEHIQRTGLL